jgi:hypothetical protein
MKVRRKKLYVRGEPYLPSVCNGRDGRPRYEVYRVLQPVISLLNLNLSPNNQSLFTGIYCTLASRYYSQILEDVFLKEEGCVRKCTNHKDQAVQISQYGRCNTFPRIRPPSSGCLYIRLDVLAAKIAG